MCFFFVTNLSPYFYVLVLNHLFLLDGIAQYRICGGYDEFDVLVSCCAFSENHELGEKRRAERIQYDDIKLCRHEEKNGDPEKWSRGLHGTKEVWQDLKNHTSTKKKTLCSPSMDLSKVANKNSYFNASIFAKT